LKIERKPELFITLYYKCTITYDFPTSKSLSLILSLYYNVLSVWAHTMLMPYPLSRLCLNDRNLRSLLCLYWNLLKSRALCPIPYAPIQACSHLTSSTIFTSDASKILYHTTCIYVNVHICLCRKCKYIYMYRIPCIIHRISYMIYHVSYI